MALSSSKVSVFSHSPIVGDVVPKKLSPFSSSLSFVLSSSSSSSLSLSKVGGRRNFMVCSAAPAPLTGVIFEPFEEVKKELLAVPMAPNVSLARQNYADEPEAAINEQIK